MQIVAMVATLAIVPPALADGMPAIKTSASNTLPSCVTPGRMQAFLEQRNPKLDRRFKSIASDYQRLGADLGVRWDFAFFQMLLETGQLSFADGARASGVKPAQNNFAGLGATGDNVSGETFPDVATGVRAHLEHLLLYAGDKLASPVADRTRKVQEWGVLAPWQKGLTHPVTFGDLVQQWAPKSKTYANRLEQIAEAFTMGACAKSDPHPELMPSNAPQPSSGPPAVAAAAAAAPSMTYDMTSATAIEKLSGAELARRAMTQGGDNRTGLGTGAIALQPRPDASTREPSPPAAPVAPAVGAATPSAQKCRVWTASYGGRRAVIVKSVIDQVANFTVLDVNEGQEAREAEAFISAYAKGGTVAGEFTTQDKALEKAFELCPEG